MFAKSKYVALGIIVGLGLANLFQLIEKSSSPVEIFLNILPFVLLFGMFIYTLSLMKKRDKENKG